VGGEPCEEEYLSQLSVSRGAVLFITEAFSKKLKNSESGVFKEFNATIKKYKSKNENFKIIPVRILLGNDTSAENKIEIPDALKGITCPACKTELECLRIILKGFQLQKQRA